MFSDEFEGLSCFSNAFGFRPLLAPLFSTVFRLASVSLGDLSFWNPLESCDFSTVFLALSFAPRRDPSRSFSRIEGMTRSGSTLVVVDARDDLLRGVSGEIEWCGDWFGAPSRVGLAVIDAGDIDAAPASESLSSPLFSKTHDSPKCASARDRARDVCCEGILSAWEGNTRLYFSLKIDSAVLF